jgi:histidinol-phosphatase
MASPTSAGHGSRRVSWPSSFSPELEAAIAAVHEAGRLQRRRFRRRHDVEVKADDTPVTVTDRQSEERIRRLLEDRFPEYGFLGEESYAADEAAAPRVSGARWIVDPLDGTKKFVRGLPFFGPCVALEREGELVAGAIHLPAMGETYAAERGQGAYLNGRPIHVSDEELLDRAYVVYDNEPEFYLRGWVPALEELIGTIYHNPGFLDLYSYGCLAAGRVDAVVMVGEAPWDTAAARVIVEEAGGRFTDFRGDPTVYGGTTIASNGPLHEPLLRLLASCTNS